MQGIGIRVEQNCALVCTRAGACMRVRNGLVLRVRGLQFSYGAPPRPPALDPPLLSNRSLVLRVLSQPWSFANYSDGWATSNTGSHQTSCSTRPRIGRCQ